LRPWFAAFGFSEDWSWFWLLCDFVFRSRLNSWEMKLEKQLQSPAIGDDESLVFDASWLFGFLLSDWESLDFKQRDLK
jgi:hypothetical protein